MRKAKKRKISKPVDASTAQLRLEERIKNDVQRQYKAVASRMEAILKRNARIAKSYRIKKDDGSDNEDNSDSYDYPPDTPNQVADQLTPNDITVALALYILMWKIGKQNVAEQIAIQIGINPKTNPIFSGAKWDSAISQKAQQILKDRQEWMSKTVAENRSNAIRDMVAKGIANGDSPQVIQTQIENYLGLVGTGTNYENPASMIAETETQWAVQEAKRQTMADIGVEYVNIVTSPDAEEICTALADENPYKIDEAQGLIPAHIHCKCSIETDWSSFYQNNS